VPSANNAARHSLLFELTLSSEFRTRFRCKLEGVLKLGRVGVRATPPKDFQPNDLRPKRLRNQAK